MDSEASTDGSSGGAAQARPPSEPLLDVADLVVGFGAVEVLRGVSFRLARAEAIALIGSSGSGKSVLMNTLIGLNPKRSGRIAFEGRDCAHVRGPRVGVLFQNGGLFSSLTLEENVMVPMHEQGLFAPHTRLHQARYRLDTVGLPASAAAKYPSEISGGMVKRAGIARALALDPALLFLDEPTSGLDPTSARQVDELVRQIQTALGFSAIIITHALSSLEAICDRYVALKDGRVAATGPPSEIAASPDGAGL